MKSILVLVWMAAAVLAQPLASPRVGFIQDEHGAVHPVLGLAGSFVMAHASATGVVSAAYSGSFGLVKTDSELMVTDQTGRTIAKEKVPPGSALFALSEKKSTALAYFERTNTLRVWNGKLFQSVALNFASLAAKSVVSIGVAASGRAAIIVERENGLWELRIGAAGGAVSQSALAGVTAPVLMLDGGLVYRDARGLVVRREDGSEKHVHTRLPEKLSFQQMGDGWVEVTDLDSGRLFAFNIDPGRERLYELPAVRQ